MQTNRCVTVRKLSNSFLVACSLSAGAVSYADPANEMTVKTDSDRGTENAQSPVEDLASLISEWLNISDPLEGQPICIGGGSGITKR